MLFPPGASRRIILPGHPPMHDSSPPVSSETVTVSSTLRPTVAEIDLGALRKNLDFIARYVHVRHPEFGEVKNMLKFIGENLKLWAG